MSTLAELAARANAAHEAGLAKHIECGETLIEAQRQCQTEGVAWLGWVEENLVFGKREAQNYMRLARNTQSIACSTINSALKSIATPREPTPRSGEPKASAPREQPPELAPPGRQLFEQYLNLSKKDRALFDVLHADHQAKLKEKSNGAKVQANGGLGAAYSGNVTPLFQRGEGAD